MQLATNREGFQPRTTIDQTKWLGIPPALFGPRMHSFRSSVSLAVRCGQPVFRTVRRQPICTGLQEVILQSYRRLFDDWAVPSSFQLAVDTSACLLRSICPSVKRDLGVMYRMVMEMWRQLRGAPSSCIQIPSSKPLFLNLSSTAYPSLKPCFPANQS